MVSKFHKNNLKRIKLPSKNAKLAEFIGVILGDGHISNHEKTYSIRIAGHSKDDKDYLKIYLAKLVEDLFHFKPSFHVGKSSNVIYLSIYGKELITFFSKMNLHPGNKVVNKSTIPNWIWEKDLYLKRCIRGLFDTDACIYKLLPHWPGLFQIQFKNKNFKLIRDARKALIRLGFIVSKLRKPNRDGLLMLYITRKNEIKKYVHNIGFKNTKHQKRYRAP